MAGKLTDLFDFLEPGEKEQLSFLNIEKININKKTSRLDIYLSGGEFLSEENLLALAEYKAKAEFDCDVKFIFQGFTDMDYAIRCLSDLIVSELSLENYEYCQIARSSSFSLKDDKLLIRSDLMNEELSDMLLNSFGRSFIDIFEAHTGMRPSGFSYEFVEDMETAYFSCGLSSDEIIKEDIMQPVPEDFIPRASNDKPKEKDKTDSSKDRNSWVYKAKEQKKIMKENDGDKKNYRKAKADALFGRVKKDIPFYKIKDIDPSEREVNFEGNIKLDEDGLRLAKSGKCVIANFKVFDETGGVGCVMFVKPEEADDFEKRFEKGGYAGIQGEPTDNRGEFGIRVSGIFEREAPKPRMENCEYKRVELHAHTKMSAQDATIVPGELMKTAARFGHKACAVTDHGVVQAFPEVFETSKKLTVGDSDEKFKAILGDEGYVVDDGPTVCYNLPFEKPKSPAIGYLVSVAVKTTGDDCCTDTMTEICLRKYHLKGYVSPRPYREGEDPQAAREFSEKDIDRSLWNEGEYEDFSIEPKRARGYVKEDYDSKFWSVITHSDDISDMTLGNTGTDDPVIPDSIEYEFVSEYKTLFTGDKWQGKDNEPVDSYFKAGEIVEFIGDGYLCGNDVFKALGFLRQAGYEINIENKDHLYYRHKFLQPVVSVYDIRLLEGKELYKEYPDLETECREVASEIIGYIKEKGTFDPYEINEKAGHYPLSRIKSKENRAFHIIYLTRNYMGLYNLYRLVSEANVHYFYRRPRTPRSLLKYFSSGLIIGGACEQGEIYRAVLNKYRELNKDYQGTLDFLKNDPKFGEMIKLYDYFEIQPLTNNMFLTREDVVPKLDRDDVRNINKLIVDLADSYGCPCCATCDAHFLNKEDGRYRMYLLMSMGYEDATEQPDLYFRTTEEMLEEFSYLGEEKAIEVVCTNTCRFADMCEYGIKPFPDGSYPPIIATAASDVQDLTWTKANRMYRHNGVLNPLVKARLEKELKSIIGNGYAIMYYIAYRLVKQSNNDGYIVGSRGSVGSSLVATMCGISEVNPLPPHYRCPNCNFVEFNETGEYGSGFDLPKKKCPHCDVEMICDGQDIPFETFLGFFGDKAPDIDLNFSSEYQPRAHKYVEYLFGKTHTFRAGTISGYAEKNAEGVARKAAEDLGITYTRAQLEFMSQGIIDVKRTTGQHPGGIVVIPQEQDIYEFTPIQYPADKEESSITTHFDFNSLHDTILKLDILGHADPTVLRMLQVLTDIDVTTIPIPDAKVMSLLESTDALGFDVSETDAGSATLGLSELGTNMARGMIKEAKPRRFYDLVQLMGLSHGTDVWSGNAQDLIRDGICDLNSVIGCRDSIMTRLIYWGLPDKDAFDIMENVRKGKVAKGAVPDKWAKWKEMMKEHDVPDWYIGSCEKIKYMFPKAHAAAYCISTLRVAWFKVYYPEEYYCAFFSIRGEEFDAETMCLDRNVLVERRKFLAEEMHRDPNPKIKSEFYLCEIVEEMYARGITFAPIDLEKSDATKFVKVEKGVIRPPLDVIDTISEAIATRIVKAREESPFRNRDDLKNRSGIGDSAVNKLADYGLLEGMPESAQVSLFDLM